MLVGVKDVVESIGLGISVVLVGGNIILAFEALKFTSGEVLSMELVEFKDESMGILVNVPLIGASNILPANFPLIETGSVELVPLMNPRKVAVTITEESMVCSPVKLSFTGMPVKLANIWERVPFKFTRSTWVPFNIPVKFALIILSVNVVLLGADNGMELSFVPG